MDEDIHERLAHGRWPEAFHLLVSRYEQRVFRLAYAILNNQADAEEAAQDAFLRIWKGLPRFRGQSSLGTWIYTVVRNTSLSARRRARPWLPLVQDVAAAPPEPREDILRLLAGVPEKYRRVLVLYHLEERSYEEIAAMLDVPMGTVKAWLHRARKELAHSMMERRGRNALRGV